MSAVKSVFAVASGLLLLTGCSGGTKGTTVTTSAPAAIVTQSASPTTPGSGSGPASADAVKLYLEALGNEDDPDSMREALKVTEPNSVAHVYLDHLANVSEAALDAGSPSSKLEMTPVGGDAFKQCDDPTDEKTCVTFEGFKINPAAKLVDLTVNKKQIEPRLTAGNGQAVTSKGTKFTFLTAYKSIQSNALFVTVKVETGSKAIGVNIYSATYRGPDGKQRTATQAVGPTDIDANSNTIIAMTFASVKAGGKVTLDGCAPKDCSDSYTAVIKVG